MKKTIHQLAIACIALCFALALAPYVWAQQGGDRRAAAAQYLAAREPQLQQITDPSKRLFVLIYLAPAALSAGETEKARSYALELISLGDQLKSQPGFGQSLYTQATHVGNLVLGRIALARSDIGGAKQYLLAAARVPGSPPLKSFGPDMELAKELIEKGEREAVVEYFDLCATFWEREDGKLAKWKNIVQQGGMPDFGPNLVYVFNSWQNARESGSTSGK
jgi:hypothetical protein